jgi:hypothetical protein
MPFLHFPFAPFFPPLFGFLGMIATISSVIGLVVGWALLQRESWARVFAIIVGIIILPSFPFGTMLGIYTLWVLVPGESEIEYRQVAKAA